MNTEHLNVAPNINVIKEITKRKTNRQRAIQLKDDMYAIMTANDTYKINVLRVFEVENHYHWTVLFDLFDVFHLFIPAGIILRK